MEASFSCSGRPLRDHGGLDRSAMTDWRPNRRKRGTVAQLGSSDRLVSRCG